MLSRNMFDDLYYPNERKGLWTKEMILLSLSNLLLYISLYIFLPSLPYWLTDKYGCSLLVSSIIVASYALAIFLPGPFNNYLLDAFKRKKVGIWSFIFLSLTALGYIKANSLMIILFLRIIQGILFSVITTTTSSTLVIDVTPTKKRTLANLSFIRIGRMGMIAGVISGIYIVEINDMNLLFYISAVASFVAGLLLLFIRVPFRAPLKPSLLSLDRFLLPRVIPAAINMISTPIILGILIVVLKYETSYLLLLLGFMIGFILMHVFFKNLLGKSEIEVSTLLVIVGFVLIIIHSSFLLLSVAGYAILGTGLSIAANRFYVIIISMPLHCERGSANNTFILIWEFGIFIGLIIGMLLKETGNMVYFIAIIVSLLSLLLYEVKIHKWYYSIMDNK